MSGKQPADKEITAALDHAGITIPPEMQQDILDATRKLKLLAEKLAGWKK